MVKRFSQIFPIGQMLVHQTRNAAIVAMLDEMNHFVHHDVLQEFRWLLG